MNFYIGVDISKHRLDVDWLGEPIAFTNEKTGIVKLIKQAKDLHAANQLGLILCEASGGYEQELVRVCHEANLPVHVAHANHVKSFVRSQGVKAKTDQIDAKMITAFGKERRTKADCFLLNKSTREMKELLRRREQFMADKKREKNRLDKLNNSEIQEFSKRHIEWLNKIIKEIDGRLSQLQKQQEVQASHALLTSIPGIGNLLGCYLLCYLPELGKISHKAISALVGVAPFNRDSGKHQGKRFVQGGRSVLRQLIYMGAMASIRYNPPLKMFYDRLRSQGKPGKVALVAVMRKLLSMVNSVMLRQTPWQENYHNA